MKDSFVMFTRVKDILPELTDAEKGQLFQAIIDYETTGEMPDVSGIVKVAFIPVKHELDYCNDKWEQTKEARSAAGKRSAEARKAKKEATLCEQDANTSATEGEQESNKAEQTLNTDATNPTVDVDEDVVVDVVVDVNEGVDVDITPQTPLTKGRVTEKQLREEFEEIWKLYPRKIGKPKSFDYYKRDRKAGASPGDILNGVSRYVAYLKATGTDDKFVRMGSTFFNQRNWQDDWEPPRTSTEKAWEEDEAWASQAMTFF